MALWKLSSIVLQPRDMVGWFLFPGSIFNRPFTGWILWHNSIQLRCAQPFLPVLTTKRIIFRGGEREWSQPNKILINITFCTLNRVDVGTPKYLSSGHNKKITLIWYFTANNKRRKRKRGRGNLSLRFSQI